MTSNEDASDIARGKRVLEIREAGGWDQATFARLLNETAERLGLDVRFDAPKVSRVENGKREVSLDDAILVAELDKKGRGVKWIAGARQAPATRRREHGTPTAPRGKPSGREESA